MNVRRYNKTTGSVVERNLDRLPFQCVTLKSIKQIKETERIVTKKKKKKPSITRGKNKRNLVHDKEFNSIQYMYTFIYK